MNKRHAAFIRFLPVSMAVLLAGLAFSCAGNPASFKLSLLHINDVYEISPDSAGNGGIAKLQTLLAAERAMDDSALFIHSGDIISPSVMSGIFKGKQMIDMLNGISLDIAIPGNHEFDFGYQVFIERIDQSLFPYICANLHFNGAPFYGMKPYLIKEIRGRKIGFFGLITPDTISESNLPSGFTIANPAETAKTVAAELKAQGANIIVAITHLSWAEDAALAASEPEIDIILGGHDHDLETRYSGSTPIIKTGQDARNLGVVLAEFTDSGRLLGNPNIKNIPNDSAVAPDPALAAIEGEYTALLDRDLMVVIGSATVALDAGTTSNRTRETNLGNFIADAIREKTGADMAIMNGGGIRSDANYGPGEITKKTVLTILPFNNVIVMTELAGSEILLALENGLSKVEQADGRFLQVSGMKLTANLANPVGSRVISAKIGGKPLDTAKKYNLATIDYLLSGGNEFKMLANGTVIISALSGPYLANTVIEKIVNEKTVAPAVGGRIVFQ